MWGKDWAKHTQEPLPPILVFCCCLKVCHISGSQTQHYIFIVTARLCHFASYFTFYVCQASRQWFIYDTTNKIVSQPIKYAFIQATT